MKIKLLFVGQRFTFMEDVISLFQQHPGFEVKFDQWKHHRIPNAYSKSLLHWADAIIVNYVTTPAVWYSRYKKPNQTLIIRFHRFEIETQYPKMLNVKNIDKLVSESSIFQSRMENMAGLSSQQSCIIYNPVNVQRLQLMKRPGSEFHLGMLGYSRFIKRPDKAFEILEKLKQRDSRYKLFFKGSSEKERSNVAEETKLMMEELRKKIDTPIYRDSVFFHSEGSDVPEWFRDIGFVLSTSDFESFHCSLAEGMASGSIPIITGWPGAHTIYPEEFISSDVDVIVDKVISYSQNKSLLERKQQEVINYCLKNFSHHVVFDQFLQLVLDDVQWKRTLLPESSIITSPVRMIGSTAKKLRQKKLRLKKKLQQKKVRIKKLRLIKLRMRRARMRKHKIHRRFRSLRQGTRSAPKLRRMRKIGGSK